MEIGKYKLEVIDGIIQTTPSAIHYFNIAEAIANQLAPSGTTEWHVICLKVMNILDFYSTPIKSAIINSVDYGTGYFRKGTESVNGRTFNESKAYVDGYADAVDVFKEMFQHLEIKLKGSLDKHLPSYYEWKKR